MRKRPGLQCVFTALAVCIAVAGCSRTPGGGALPQAARQTTPGVKYILHVLPLFYYPGGTKGTDPVPVLAGNPATALYGVTTQGGADGYGTIYKLTPSNGTYKETVIHNFNIDDLSDGAYPSAPLGPLNGPSGGNFYGTTEYGGEFGQGTVFEVSASTGHVTVLHSFQGGLDGALPASILHMDSTGALYGTTLEGGCTQAGGGCCPIGCGTVYKLTPSGSTYTEHVIYAFQGGTDGIYPWGGVEAIGPALYGTTYGGGNNNCGGGGCGTLYKLNGSGTTYTFKTIYSFAGSDGAHPHSRLLATAGTLYGTTLNGGSSNCANGCGTIFSLTPGSSGLNWSHPFAGGSDGNYPYTGLTYNKGVLYGTTLNGGDTAIQCAKVVGCGTIFSITPGGASYSSFYQFGRPADGNNPDSSVFSDQTTGVVYGTASDGGDSAHNDGWVFELQ